MKDLLPQNQFLYFWPLPVNTEFYCSTTVFIELLICLMWRFERRYHPATIRQIRNNNITNLVFKICDVFVDDYCMNLTAFTAWLESREIHFNNSCVCRKPLEFPVKSDMITQLLTDTLIRGWQTTRKVNVSGVLFFPFPWKKKLKQKQKKKTPYLRFLGPPLNLCYLINNYNTDICNLTLSMHNFFGT